jgi:hypothetical protein
MRQKLRSRRPSHGTVVAYLGLFVALGGTTYAATGGNFILGQPNSASSTTSLSAPVAGKALQLSNTNTAAGATALGLNVASGHSPFTVNSGTKVANLNADRLDDKDSSQFIQGKGSVRQKAGNAPPGGGIALDSNDVFGLEYLCPSDLSQGGAIFFANRTAATGNLFVDEGLADPFYTPIAGNLGTFTNPTAAPQDWQTFHLQTANGRFATIFVGTVHRPSSNDCHAQFQAVISRP